MVRYRGLRIGGISGIFDNHHYHLPHFEVPPYTGNTLRSVYHSRSIDHSRMTALSRLIYDNEAALSPKMDIFLSHDWPEGVYNYGDVHRLVAVKPYFSDDINRRDLGSKPLMEVLHSLQPRFWFSAHLHVKFSAVVPHENGEVTRFLALDKVIPGRCSSYFV